MNKRKDLPIGMGPKTEEMIEELEFFFRLNGHDLVRKLVGDLDDSKIRDEFLAYNKKNKIKRIEKSVRIRGFKFKEDEIKKFTETQWDCRIKGISTFIKQLIYFNYEKHIEAQN